MQLKLAHIMPLVRNFTVASARHLLTGAEHISEDELKARWDTCQSCELFLRKNGYGVCSLQKGGCGCTLSKNTANYLNKLLWKTSTCPRGKWEV